MAAIAAAYFIAAYFLPTVAAILVAPALALGLIAVVAGVLYYWQNKKSVEEKKATGAAQAKKREEVEEGLDEELETPR